MNTRPRLHRLRNWNRWKLWEAWVVATAIGQLLGLGVILLFTTHLQALPLSTETIFLLIGVLEGLILGCCQWLVLRRYVHHIAGWIVATMLGAIVAWMGGAFVSLLIVISHAGRSDHHFYKEILLLGASLGGVIGFAQWFVLRTHIRRASWWIIGNALAWSIGLLVAFTGAGLSESNWTETQVIFAKIATGATMGSVIGAITGILLVWLLQPRSSRSNSGNRSA